MGGGAHGLAVARPLRLDGLCRQPAGAGAQARPRAGADAWRSPSCWCAAASASAMLGLDAARSAARAHRRRRSPSDARPTAVRAAACRRPRAGARSPRRVLFGDFLDPRRDASRRHRRDGRARRAGHLVMVLDPAEETFPYEGRHGARPTGRPATLRSPTSGPARRSMLDQHEAHRDRRCAKPTHRLGWTFLVHRTDRPASRGAARAGDAHADRGAGSAGAGRRRLTRCRLRAARLHHAPASCSRPGGAAGDLVAAAHHPAAAAPHRVPAARILVWTSRTARRRRRARPGGCYCSACSSPRW